MVETAPTTAPRSITAGDRKSLISGRSTPLTKAPAARASFAAAAAVEASSRAMKASLAPA